MIDFHLKNKADVTVSANIVSVKEASAFGVMSVNDSNRIISFDEKPQTPKGIPGNPKTPMFLWVIIFLIKVFCLEYYSKNIAMSRHWTSAKIFCLLS